LIIEKSRTLKSKVARTALLKQFGLTGHLSFMCQNNYMQSNEVCGMSDQLHQRNLGPDKKLMIFAHGVLFRNCRETFDYWMHLDAHYGVSGLPVSCDVFPKKKCTGSERAIVMELLVYKCMLVDSDLSREFMAVLIQRNKMVALSDKMELFLDEIQELSLNEQEYMIIYREFVNSLPRSFQKLIGSAKFPKNACNLEYSREWRVVRT